MPQIPFRNLAPCADLNYSKHLWKERIINEQYFGSLKLNFGSFFLRFIFNNCDFSKSIGIFHYYCLRKIRCWITRYMCSAIKLKCKWSERKETGISIQVDRNLIIRGGYIRKVNRYRYGKKSLYLSFTLNQKSYTSILCLRRCLFMNTVQFVQPMSDDHRLCWLTYYFICLIKSWPNKSN